MQQMSATDFVRCVLAFYRDASDDEVLSVGHWDTPEPDPQKMTIHTLPRFIATTRTTVGDLRAMVAAETSI